MVDVICPGCKGHFHETTADFDPAATSHNGSMFKLKKKYGPQGFNWTSFPNNVGIRCGDLECPSCGAPYCSGGFKVQLTSPVSEPVPEPTTPTPTFLFDDEKITTIPPEQPAADAHVCEECGKVCKSHAGLVAHKRFSKHGTTE